MKRLNLIKGRPFRRGDMDAEGNVFFCYQKNIMRDDGYFGERWITKKEIIQKQQNKINGYKKTCSKCKREFIAVEHFYEKISSKDGFDPWCKECFLLKNRKWFMENRERHHELTASWYEQNKEKHLATSKETYRKNPKRKLVDYYRRQERTAQATPKWVDKSELLKVYEDAGRLSEESGIPHEVDHIIPLFHNLVCGLNVPWNLQILTQTQNRKKANKWTPPT